MAGSILGTEVRRVEDLELLLGKGTFVDNRRVKGLTHAVFAVNDLEKELERLLALGTEVLIPPMEISAGIGSRRLAFCRSPGGLVFEVMQIHESLV